ncbi:MAG: C1 family peptidase, partial [Desulfococcaceae bacterium]|nr:C1 family peptidase [Desulfococcaceae bacterium]
MHRKRKFVYGLVVLVFGIILLSGGGGAFGATPGNVDGAGDVVDLKDVIMSLQVDVGLAPAGVTTGGDANGDGRIGLAEAVYGLQVVAKIREAVTSWYKDADGDGYSDGTQITSAVRPDDTYYTETELIVTSGDTNDDNPNIFPVGAPTEFARILTGIEESGAQWTAEPNPVSVLPREDRIRKLGAIIPSDVGSRAKRTFAMRETLPASFDWRNNNGNFVTPVKDQGYCGSCWAFATTAALESQVLITSGQSIPDLSEQIVLSCSEAGSCNGGYIDTASDFLRDTGTNLETCYPYTETDGNCNNACTNWRNSTSRTDSWYEVAHTVADMKSAVYNSGPVVTTMAVYSDFYSYRQGVYSYTSGYLDGYHAIVIVGWDDSQSCFIVKNSWGTWWGDSGYFRIAYSEVTGNSQFGYWTIAYTKNAPCTYAISPVSDWVSASGGSGSVSVTAGTDCSWTAASNAGWITVTSGSAGSGNGTVTYSAVQNTTASSRTGTLTIAGKTFTLTQAGSCIYSISPSDNSFSGAGGSGSVNVTALAGCAWTASSNAVWLTVTPGSGGSGNGTVTYSVAQNTGSSRIGTLTVAGKTFTVTQSANCIYTIAPADSSVSSSGGSGSVNVTAGSGCAWTAVSNAAWISISSDSGGTGNGIVTYTAAQNTGTDSRTGTLTIGGQAHTVTQSGDCTYTISQTTTVPANGGTGTVSITASAGCQWTVASGSEWLTITSDASGTGNGTVSYSVAANTGGVRSGFLSIAGKAFSLITQLGFCSYTISPTGNSVPASGGTGIVDVSSQSGCNMTASSNATWITITAITGSSVSYSVAANTDTVSRTGTLTIAGKTFTVTQSADEFDTYTNSLGMTFNLIPAGTFVMGSPANELGRDVNETQHQVTLSKSYYMMTTEVTQGQWTAVTGSNPSSFNDCGDDCPVNRVSWNDIQTFITQMNQRGEGTYRLPTEAEWEYAARAGSTTAFANGEITTTECTPPDSNLDAMGWYCGNADNTIHPVARKQANAWGLYDMHGNVWEWCQDWYDGGDYSPGAVTDPEGPLTGSERILRGGGWNSLTDYCRSADRYVRLPASIYYTNGFRLV